MSPASTSVTIHGRGAVAYHLGDLAGYAPWPNDVIAYGHTHLPYHRIVNGVHFVNTGSVGRPKDGDWRAGYVVVGFGPDNPSIEFVRVEYDVKKAADGIRASTLPPELADFLEAGGKVTAAH